MSSIVCCLLCVFPISRGAFSSSAFPSARARRCGNDPASYLPDEVSARRPRPPRWHPNPSADRSWNNELHRVLFALRIPNLSRCILFLCIPVGAIEPLATIGRAICLTKFPSADHDRRVGTRIHQLIARGIMSSIVCCLLCVFPISRGAFSSSAFPSARSRRCGNDRASRLREEACPRRFRKAADEGLAVVIDFFCAQSQFGSVWQRLTKSLGIGTSLLVTNRC
jgi:hypothetical protein